MKTTMITFSNVWQRYAVLMVALLMIALSPAYAEQLTSGVSFAQISFTVSNPPEKYSHYGEISIDYTMLYGEGYINVERYENGQAAGWVVKNLPVVNGSILSGFSTMFDLGATGYRRSLVAYVNFSTAQLGDDSSLRNQTPLVYALGQAELQLLPPAANNNVFSVQLSSQACQVGDQIKTFVALAPPLIAVTTGMITHVCVQNRTGIAWSGLSFTDAAAPPVAIKGSQYSDNKLRWLFDTVVAAGLVVDFKGVVRHGGIPAGTDARATLFADGAGGTVNIQPR